MTRCIACRENKVRILLDFGPQPVCHHYYDGGQAEGTHPLTVAVCEACAQTQLVNPIPPEKLIPRVDWISYNEAESHLDEMVDMLRGLPGITSESTVAGLTYKEDTTLRRFRERGHTRTWRVDAQADLEIQNSGAGIETIQNRVQPSVAGRLKKKYGVPDLMLMRHVIEHTLDTPLFLETFRQLIKPDGYVVFEVPEYTRAFDVPYYATLWEDHSLYFVEKTLIGTLERNGFSVVRFERYRATYENCMVAVTQPKAKIAPYSLPGDSLDRELQRVANFAARFESRFRRIRETLTEWKKNGRIAIFGAGHQTAMFLNLFQLADLVDCVIDDNQRKCGLRMPGCRLPIVGSKVLQEPDVKLCLLSLSAESERNVVNSNQGFLQRRGTFTSILPLQKGRIFTHIAGPAISAFNSIAPMIATTAAFLL